MAHQLAAGPRARRPVGVRRFGQAAAAALAALAAVQVAPALPADARPVTDRPALTHVQTVASDRPTATARAVQASRRTGTAKPTAATTGVPRGTKLRTHRGNLVITKAGTHLDRLDIHGFVVVKAPRVRITRSIIRGGRNPKTAMGLVTNYGYPGLLIEDTLLRPDHPSVSLDGIKGWGFTARRVHVVGGVDSIKIHGHDVKVERSLLENTQWFAHDPYQRGGPTHNDNIQVMKGHNISIRGNTIRGASNFAILGSASLGDTPDLVIAGNWLDGGHCTVKLSRLKSYRLRVQLSSNRFGPNRRISYCPVQAEPQIPLSAWDNRYEWTRRPIVIYRGR